MTLKITSEVWKKVLKLKSDRESQGKILTRRYLGTELEGVGAREIRILHDLVNSLPVILKESGQIQEARLRESLSLSTSRNKELLAEIARLSKLAELQQATCKKSLTVPNWITGTDKSRNTATACAMLSDTHFDEVVDPAEINGINAYNREIATERLENYFRSLVKLRSNYFTGVEIEGLVLMMAGDMVSGIIHEELSATNDYSITDTLIYYSELICAGVNLLSKEYGNIYIPAVVGNHGRLTQKFKFKGAVRDNFDYLFYKIINSGLKENKSVTMNISESPDLLVKVYDTTFMLTHGNQFRGGSGWSGPLLPVIKGDTKKRDRQSAVDQPYDVLCCGHFHTQKFLGNQIMGGSLIGYNEFAACGNFGYEPPQQPFWLVDPVHGVTITAPIHCE